jgi:hypothetical protein
LLHIGQAHIPLMLAVSVGSCDDEHDREGSEAELCLLATLIKVDDKL